ncbi:unnamed protein product, partial [Clonostachys rosea f. rosea IK726]
MALHTDDARRRYSAARRPRYPLNAVIEKRLGQHRNPLFAAHRRCLPRMPPLGDGHVSTCGQLASLAASDVHPRSQLAVRKSSRAKSYRVRTASVLMCSRGRCDARVLTSRSSELHAKAFSESLHADMAASHTPTASPDTGYNPPAASAGPAPPTLVNRLRSCRCMNALVCDIQSLPITSVTSAATPCGRANASLPN